MKTNHSPKLSLFFHTIVFLLTLFCINVILAESESLTKNSSDTNNTIDLHRLKMAVQQSKLTADDASTLDFFGFSVSLSGNRALIGVRGKRAAYVFELSNGIWTQTAKLTPTDVAFNFGVSVSLSGDRALIGANQSASFAGSAYIFDFANGNWTQTAKLTANDAASGDQFGVSVNLSVDNRALIGAPFDDNGGFIDAGSAYVFEFSGGIWSQIAKLTASDQAANDEFGISVSLSGAPVNLFIARALIGAAKNESAYIFESTGGNWLETNILKANMGSVGDQFGRSVSLYADTALVNDYLGWYRWQ